MAGRYIYPSSIYSGDFLSLTGGTVTGDTRVIGNFSADTYFSGSTNLYDIFQTIGSDVLPTHVQPGTNINTGGTAIYPIINLNPDIVLDSVSANTISGLTIFGGAIYSGGTDLSYYFGQINNQLVLLNNNKYDKTGGTISGNVQVTGSLTLNTLNSNLILSAGTNLYDIFLTTVDGNDITRVQNGLNTYTGGTANNPTINISGGTFDNITVSGTSSFNVLSATTIYSGSTNLSTIIGNVASFTETHVQPGTNTFTGGTASNPSVNVTGLTVNNINVSGDSIFNSLTASTLYSGSTNLSTYFGNINNNVASLSSQTLSNNSNINSISAQTLINSANISILSGNVSSLSASVSSNTSSITSLQNNKYDKSGGTIGGDVIVTGNVLISGNTTILGTATTLYTQTVQVRDNNIVLNYSGNNLTAIGGGITLTSGQTSGAASTILSDQYGNWTISPGLSATTVSGGTLYSGSTNLYDIFQKIGTDTEHTHVQPGTNINTGGTVSNPIVNLNDNISLNSVSGNSISASTIFSGNTNLSTYFGNLQNNINQKYDKTGGTISGNIQVTGNLTANSINGNIVLSAGTNLYDIFQKIGTDTEHTHVQPGTNINTGGTVSNPIINLNNNITLNSVSATTISGQTFFSGGTDISNLFVNSLSGGVDNRIVRWDGSNKLQSSSILIDDFGTILPLSSKTQDIGSSGYSFANAFVESVNYDTSFVIKSGSLTAFTIDDLGNIETIGLQILETGEVQTIGLGNGFATPNTRGLGAVELQTERNVSSQVASGNYTAILGGRNNMASDQSSVVVGGDTNSATGFSSSVVGGTDNVAGGVESFVGGGESNSAFGNRSTIPGGLYNIASGFSQTVIGKYNTVQGTIGSYVDTDYAFIVGNGTSTSSRSNAFGLTWQGLLQTNPITGTLPTTNVYDGAIAYSAGTGLFQYISGNWFQLASASLVTGTTASNVGTGVGLFKQKVADDLQFKSLSAGTNININSSSNEVAVALKDNITLGSISATTISGGTIYSGSTNLQNIITSLISSTDTYIQNGINTYTGGTNYRPTVNVSGLTIDNINVSGSSVFNVLTASTLSANTIYVENKIEPIQDNVVDLGSSIKRYRSLHTVNGIATSFTASTKVTIGTTDVTEYNIILTGNTINGGIW